MSRETSDLKQAGLKATRPRLMILQLLEDSEERHLTAEGVYRSLLDAGEEVGLATVYRVLTQFEQAGLVKRHHFDGERAFFELDENKHHDHMVCVRCGRVEEFYNEQIERLQQEVAKEHGFRLTDHRMELYGLCADCLREKQEG
ncbi:Fur family transcriptional regulator [Thiohalorhabdus denitrificans]|uniref:Ferric uptake regulation protein n=1 Tax=Thiohalorhabdus denitrificans TaxID=381306 RepID=A0A0P9EGN3_9GAMM|nr:ferric iron uptake transcriptional regulator [Thiohalorhabdus denitrificans]KPV41659.1 Fur family transcriptional regulator [Thiohalorhabdus denitrificans]SCY56297.1 Fur family transcriptional regulator, ferric uptake regulator [Thiohalorhabdus denitrificans]